MLIVRLEAGLLDINGTLIAELIAFLLMLGVLARWVYPPIVRAAEARQKQMAEQLQAAEQARREAEAHLRQAEASIQEARVEGQRIIDTARRAAEQAGQQVRDRAAEEAKRILAQAARDVEAERQRALQTLRVQIADLALLAAGRVIGESLDGRKHRELIERTLGEAELNV